MILLTHPTGNQNVRQAASALADAGLLREFWTCIQWGESGLLDHLLPEGIRRELRRRSFPPELRPFIHTWPWRDWGRQLAGRFGWDRLLRHETGLFCVDAVYRSLDRKVARRLRSVEGLRAVYAYDPGAPETLRAAKAAGLVAIFEHPIIHWRLVRQIQEEEAQRHPEWIPTLGALHDSPQKLGLKDEELRMADLIIVASTFSRDSLALAPGLKAKIEVVPYGAPGPQADGGTVGRWDGGTVGRWDGRTVGRADSQTVRQSDRPTGSPLRVLFVGGLSQAKGLGYLLQAAARLGRHIELTLIGKRLSPVIPEQAVLDRHRWIPWLSHDELLTEMSRHDVLVFPSLHEGFGLVILEAMSRGLVVITTPHTAGPDVISEGQDGFIVPIRSAEAIEETLELLAADRPRLEAMREAAIATARRCTWEGYRRRLVEVVREAVGGGR